jgi:hypothetical protein
MRTMATGSTEGGEPTYGTFNTQRDRSSSSSSFARRMFNFTRGRGEDDVDDATTALLRSRASGGSRGDGRTTMATISRIGALAGALALTLLGVGFRRVDDAFANDGAAPVVATTTAGTFTVVVDSCVLDELRSTHPQFFSYGAHIVGAKLIHHNLGTTEFFEWEQAIDMPAVAGSGGKKYRVTTSAVDFEYGFALVNSVGEYLYEIGTKATRAPLSGAYVADEDNCVQKYGYYFNRVRSRDKTPNNVEFLFGSCASECPPPPPPPSPPPPSPPPPSPSPPPPESAPDESASSFQTSYHVSTGHFLVGDQVIAEAACASGLSASIQQCEETCNGCDSCVGFVRHKSENRCTFHTGDDVTESDGHDWYGRHAPAPAPETETADGTTDASIGIADLPNISNSACASCTAKLYAHCPPGFTTGACAGHDVIERATLTTITSHVNPVWVDIPVGDISGIVVEGDDNCRLVTDADQCYDFDRNTGMSGGSTTPGTYSFPLPIGNDNIHRAYLHCASDTTDAEKEVVCPTAPSCSNCQAVFYQHWAPGHGDTGSVLATITAAQMTTDLSNPNWINMASGGVSSMVMTGESECRVKTDRDTTYEYARTGSSGGGAEGVYNYPMASGNDVVARAYMWCADVASSTAELTS